jgi:hypothetical protein
LEEGLKIPFLVWRAIEGNFGVVDELYDVNCTTMRNFRKIFTDEIPKLVFFSVRMWVSEMRLVMGQLNVSNEFLKQHFNVTEASSF